MLAISNISKSYGVKTVLQNVSFTVKTASRAALVGPNGCGKSTLLRILMGEEKPDSGSVRFTPSSISAGYLPQGLTFTDSETIGNYLSAHYVDPTILSQQLEELAVQLAFPTPSDGLLVEYDMLLQQIEAAAQDEHRAQTILSGLGLNQFNADTPLMHLSGGQKTRLALAGILLSNPQFLIFDEPTNHLDIEMLEWLENWLQNLSTPMLIVSHDRAFLDNVATTILELDPVSHSVREYSGNYSDYLAQKSAEAEHQWQMYLDQQGEISRLQGAAAHMRGIAKFKKGGKADGGDKFAKGYFANRSLGTVGRAKHIEARVDRLLTEDRIEKPRQTWQMKVEFGDTAPSGRDVVILQNATIGYPNYPPLLSEINAVVKYGQRVALIGPNGAGKTTLLRTITGKLQPQSGEVRLGSNVQIGYMAQEHENLDFRVDALTSLAHISPLTETELRSFLSKYLFKGDDVFTPVEQMSFGERSRLSLALLVARGCNFLMLDEPINHLDIPSRVRFEESLKNFEGTVLAVVHDRYFISNFASTIWEVKNQTLIQVA